MPFPYISPSVVDATDVTALSPQQQADAFFRGTRDLAAYVESEICPILQAQIAKSEYEEAVCVTYYRIALLLRGLSALNDPCHFQFANTTARTIFELFLDIELLLRERSSAARFHAFTEVSRFHKGLQLVEYLNSTPTIDKSPHQHVIQFVADLTRRSRIEQLCINHWGTANSTKPRWPDHWSGADVFTRARAAGDKYTELYRSQYFLQSYSIHAGPAAVQGLPFDVLVCSFAIAHRLIQMLVADATLLIAGEFKLFEADANLRTRLSEVSAATGFYAVQTTLSMQSEDLDSSLRANTRES